MAKGIKTGGRKKGTPNKKTRELLDLNYCPVEELLKLAKRKNITIEQAITIHKALLPYFYPQRKAIDSMIFVLLLLSSTVPPLPLSSQKSKIKSSFKT